MFRPKIDRIEYGGAILGIEEVKAVMDVMLSQGGKRWTVGPESVAFEKELAEKTGVRRAVVVNSGSSALLVALTALKLPKGSKVIIPAVNFPTAFNAIIQCGLVPYVVDVDLKTLNMDLEEVKKAVQYEKISAVIAVNIASNPNDLVALRSIVGDAKIILDNCDGYGTLVNGEFAEKQADISCVSFHAAHIITTGEGGACLTDDEKLADRCLKLREWGRASGTDEIYEYPGFPEDYRSRYVYEEIGYNMKPLELQCAMGRVQLTRLEGFREKRLANEKLMRAVFEKYPQFTLIESPKNADVCWFSFPLLCKGIKRKLVMDTLEANNIECRTIFSGNVLRHPAYKDTEYVSHGEMVNADIVMRDGMFLSVHPSITPEMIAFIDEVVGDICK
jgi:CDP-4-dehydro-6-deoxyglucose reductase, E1